MANFFDQFDAAEVTPTQRAFLTAMRGGESGGRYNVMYGGKTFDSYADHPRQPQPIRSGPNAGNVSTAAGADQFLARTWDEAKNALGLPDFSPESQDRAAVWLAERDYKKRTNGRDLWSDLENAKNNPEALNFIGGALSKTWTSLPGGAEPNKATGGFGQRFATEFSSQAKPKAGGNFFDQFDAQPSAPEQRQPEGPPRAPVSMAESVVRGANQGVLANFGDEFAGLRSASGLPIDLGGGIPGALQAGVGAARMGLDYLTGGSSAQDAYNQRVEIERERNKQAETQNPWSYMGGNVAGAVALPGGQMLQAATLPARMARGAAVGAGYGAASGAGEGEGALDRASRGTAGAGIGGLVGGAVPVAATGVEAVGKGIAAAASPITNKLRGAVNPDKQAARTVVEYLEKDAKRGGAELSGQEFGAAQAAGLPVANVDRGGESTRALARWAANVSPEARDTIQKFADQRFEGQAERAVTFLQNIAGTSGNTTVLRDAMKGLARIENRPAYNKAYNHPNAQGMWDEGFEQIAQAPVVQNAIRAASVTGANRGTIEGFQRIRSPFVVDKATGQLTLRVDEAGNRTLPNLQFWDHVKRNLDKIDTPEARALNDALKSHLDDLVPAYKDARAGAAKFFGAEDAMDAGQKFVHQNMAVHDAAKALSKMTPAERDLFKIGFASKLIDDIGNTRDRINIVNKIGQTPLARQKLQMVLGPNGFNQIDALMSVEQSMDKLRAALGNSTTVRQWVELGLAGGVGGSGLVNTDPTQLGIAAAIAGRRYVDQRVARKVADMLTSSDPDILAKGIKAVAGNKNLLRAFRDFDTRLSAVGGQQAQVPLPVQGAARAENDNQNGGLPGQHSAPAANRSSNT